MLISTLLTTVLLKPNQLNTSICSVAQKTYKQQGAHLPEKEPFKIKGESGSIPDEWHRAKYTEQIPHPDGVSGAHWLIVYG